MLCERCNGLCCKRYVVLINSADARRISSHLDPLISPLSYLKMYEKAVGAGEFPPIFLNNTVGGVLGLARRENDHSCFFLNQAARCEIHAFKPLTCLNYPYRIYNPLCPGPWEIEDKSMEALINQYIQEDLAFQSEVANWNENYSDKDFPAFLRFIKCL